MVIVGIDPGTATTGYGVVELREGGIGARDYGVIRTPAGAPLPQRLHSIYDNIARLFDEHAPDVIVVEQLFFSRNATSAFAVGQARGVLLLAAAQRNVEVVEYTPMEVKVGVTGQGRAPKEQVAFMVRALLSLDRTPRPDDAADALAIALCHAHRVGAEARTRKALSGGSVP